MSRGHPESHPTVPSTPEEYLEAIRAAVVTSLRIALTKDPTADVVVLASRDGDASQVTTVPRAQAIAALRSVARYADVLERISSPPSVPGARWLVMVTTDFCASSSVVVVDHRQEAQA